MEVKNWERIEDIFHAALPLDARARAAHLDDACAGDEGLRVQVESLLAALEQRADFLEEGAFSLGLRVLSDSRAGSLVGKQIGPYKILSQLGRGGMGEVYLAKDTRLGREVALKFLSAQLAGDSWAKRQLMKEAQAAAMIEHSNICSIYGIEEAEGHSFIVMQYAEGETLSDIIRTRPPNVAEAVAIATQIVGAVTEAHAHGIIHRDLKPQNVVVSASGRVKVLDFGLAKIVERKHKLGDFADDSGGISKSGLVVGTVAYMSPEQLRAERLDFRSDIFSLGTLLYELFSGRRPFARHSDAEVISAILTSQPPPLASASGDVPPALNRSILKCLEKDEEQRYQSASELLYELNSLRDRGEKVPPWWHLFSLRAVAAFVLLLLLITVSAFALLRLRREQREFRTLAVLPVLNADASPGLEPLSNGLTEDLINKLSGLPPLRVKALTVVSGYKGKEINPVEVGRGLRVDAVLSGTLVQRGEALELRVSLIDTSDGSQLWHEEYSARPDQVLDLQEDVAWKVAFNLAPWAVRGAGEFPGNRPTERPDALREYHAGRNLWEKRSKDNIRQIIAHFEKAIELDPSYAEPYAGLASCYTVINTVAYLNMPTDEAMKKAQYRARQALELNESLPEAITALGIVKFKYEWKWQEAETEFRRAIAIKPDYAWAHYWYSQLLAVNGRWDEAIAQGQEARDLAPFSALAGMNSCRTLYYARLYDKAEACFAEVLAAEPGHKSSLYVLSYVYMQQARSPEAIAILEKMYKSDKLMAAAPLGFAYGMTGRRDAARRVLAELREEVSRERAKGGQVPAHEEALIHIGLGDKDQAFAILEKSYDERFSPVIFLTADPIYDSLRSDERFANLRRRLNLTQPA